MIVSTEGLRIFTIPFFPSGVAAPTDSTSYYFGTSQARPTATETDHDINFGMAFRVIGAVITVSNNTIAGTTEVSTISLRNVTQGTSSTLGTIATNASATSSPTATYNSLNISVASTDSIAIQWTTPAWATNPTDCIMRVVLICSLA